MIPYGRQHIDEDDIAAVVDVLRGDWLTQGPHVQQFEHDICAYTGAAFAVAFANGTAALHAAAWAAEIGPGSRVYTSPLSFAASANCVRYVGGDVDFLDVDPATLNLDLAALPADADAVIAVHYAGLPADLRQLRARPRVVIEDAAQAFGAITPDGPVGNGAHSDLCCFSFHPVKTITTAEGGAVTTNSSALAERLRRFRHHGIVPTPDLGAWSYDIPELGYNYRLTDLQAALGSSQLRKVDAFVQRRNEIAAAYRVQLADVEPVTLPPAARDDFLHAYHLFPIQVPDRRGVFDRLRATGIAVQVHHVPTYHFGAYADLHIDRGAFPATEAAYAGLLSLPMFPDLTDDDQHIVVEALKAAL
jgi:perosamine synthetase